MNNDRLDPRLEKTFNELQKIPPRSPQVVANGRAIFLKQAADLREAVSRKADQRHNSWYDKIFPLFQKKEHVPMLKPFFAVVLSVALLFGGSGATVYAAQGSLPDQALYPIKTWSEDAMLSITGSAQTRLSYMLDFSDHRVTEMAGLLAAGKPIPQGVEARFQNELNQVLELAASMDDLQAKQQMVQIRQRAETQAQTMTILMSGALGSAEPLLLMAQTRLQEQIQFAAMGEVDMSGFRMKIQNGFLNMGGSEEPTPGTGNHPQGPGPMNPTMMPGSSGTGNRPTPMGPTTMPGPSGTGNTPGPGMHRTPMPKGGSNRMP